MKKARRAEANSAIKLRLADLTDRLMVVALDLGVVVGCVARGMLDTPRKARRLKAAIVLFLLSAVITACASAPVAAKQTADGATPPNILLVLTDDLSHGTLGAALVNNWMPNLKSAVIDQGMTFQNFYIADSLCCPSRATLLTGQYSHNHGVRTNVPPLGGVVALNDSSTLATWLRAAGYRTGLVGKYLNGYGLNADPSSPKDNPTYVPPGWDDWQGVTVPDQMFNYAINDNGVLQAYGSQPSDYQTDVLAARAVAFIDESEANDAQPFLLLVTTQAPHQETGFLCSLNVGSIGPLAPAPRHAGQTANLQLQAGPSFNESNVSDKPTWIKGNFSLLTAPQIDCLETGHRNRVGSLLAVDDLIGTITAALQTAGELGNTLIVFCSDNGFLLGEHRVNSKQQAFEEAIRVPLYVKGPGVVAQAVAQQLVVNVDLAATFVELAQATAGLMQDGRSFAPILQDPAFVPWRSHVLIEHVKSGGAVVPPDYSAVRTTQYKWVEYANGEKELYDLTNDPGELVSQHANPAYFAVKDALRPILNLLRTCAGATCWL